MFTEFGACTIAGLHLAIPNMFTEEYQVDYFKANVEVFDKFDCVVGEQVCNFADFQTKRSIMCVDGNKKRVFTCDHVQSLQYTTCAIVGQRYPSLDIN